MLTKQKKPFNTSTKMLPLSDSAVRLYDTMMKSRSTKILSPEELEKKFTQLYLQNQRWTEKKEKMRQERKQLNQQKELEGCTFHPSINPEIEAFMTSGMGSFLKRQDDWVSKKEKKIKQLQTQSQKKMTKQCSFRPKISKKSYSLLFKNKESQKKPQNLQTSQEKPLNSSRSFVGSYRLIHQKKDSYRELRNTASFKAFTLMTERRFLERLQQQTNQKAPNATQQNSIQQFSQEQFSFSSINLPYLTQATTSQPVYDDYIENIVIKTEQQDTFNSLSSLEMKSERKPQNEEIKDQIFEEEVEQQSVQEEKLEEKQDQVQESHSDQSSYDEQADDNLSNNDDSKIIDQEEQIKTEVKEEQNQDQIQKVEIEELNLQNIASRDQSA